jgi:hypothetical protein
MPIDPKIPFSFGQDQRLAVRGVDQERRIAQMERGGLSYRGRDGAEKGERGQSIALVNPTPPD